MGKFLKRAVVLVGEVLFVLIAALGIIGALALVVTLGIFSVAMLVSTLDIRSADAFVSAVLDNHGPYFRSLYASFTVTLSMIFAGWTLVVLMAPANSPFLDWLEELLGLCIPAASRKVA